MRESTIAVRALDATEDAKDIIVQMGAEFMDVAKTWCGKVVGM